MTIHVKIANSIHETINNGKDHAVINLSRGIAEENGAP